MGEVQKALLPPEGLQTKDSLIREHLRNMSAFLYQKYKGQLEAAALRSMIHGDLTRMGWKNDELIIESIPRDEIVEIQLKH